jgi:hypothetical protein
MSPFAPEEEINNQPSPPDQIELERLIETLTDYERLSFQHAPSS